MYGKYPYAEHASPDGRARPARFDAEVEATSRGGNVAFQKISVNLSDEVLGALKEMARRDSVTMTEMLRRSISTQKFINDAQESGKHVVLEDPSTKERTRVVFR